MRESGEVWRKRLQVCARGGKLRSGRGMGSNGVVVVVVPVLVGGCLPVRRSGTLYVLPGLKSKRHQDNRRVYHRAVGW